MWGSRKRRVHGKTIKRARRFTGSLKQLERLSIEKEWGGISKGAEKGGKTKLKFSLERLGSKGNGGEWK